MCRRFLRIRNSTFSITKLLLCYFIKSLHHIFIEICFWISIYLFCVNFLSSYFMRSSLFCLICFSDSILSKSLFISSNVATPILFHVLVTFFHLLLPSNTPCPPSSIFLQSLPSLAHYISRLIHPLYFCTLSSISFLSSFTSRSPTIIPFLQVSSPLSHYFHLAPTLLPLIHSPPLAQSPPLADSSSLPSLLIPPEPRCLPSL